MNKHEIRSITKIGGVNGGATVWYVKYRRYGITDANDGVYVNGIDEAEAFKNALKQLEGEV